MVLQSHNDDDEQRLGKSKTFYLWNCFALDLVGRIE